MRRDAALAVGCGRIEANRLRRSRGFRLLGLAIPALVLCAGLAGALVLAVPDIAGSMALVSLITAALAVGAGAGAATGGGRLAADRAKGWLWRLSLTPMPRRDYLAGRAAAGVVVAAIVIVLVHLLAAAVAPSLRDPLLLLRSLVWTTLAAIPAILIGCLAGLVARSRAWGLGLAGSAYLVLVLLAMLGALVGARRLDPGVLATIALMVPTFDAGLLAAAAPGSLPPSVPFAAAIALVLETAVLALVVVVVGRRALLPARRAGHAGRLRRGARS